jgi:hypothetical protein
MVRVRVPSLLHRPAARRGTNTLAWLPGWRGTGKQPMQAVPITRYRGTVSGVPLSGGQASAVVPGSGTVTLSIGPQGLGTVWYPTQMTISTTTGLLDTSVASVYAGSGQVPNQLVAQLFSGNGVVAQVPTQLAPGQTMIVTWTGAHPGDTAAMNIIGTMDALSTE